MTPQEIKRHMVRPEWETSELDDSNILDGDEGFILTTSDGDFSGLTDSATAAAICTAVNGTYGKNMNPEKVEEMYKALENIRTALNNCSADWRNTVKYIDNLLESAKIS